MNAILPPPPAPAREVVPTAFPPLASSLPRFSMEAALMRIDPPDPPAPDPSK